jgi:glycosyltransferase involved in cell wall biosynthesis
VIRPGRLSDADRRDFFAGIDAFALPSRSDSFGLVLLEAWANGKPVLAYRAGGPGAIVRDGVDGWLARYSNVEQLARCLEQVCSHPAERERRGGAGQARCAREFRWDDKLDLVEDTLRTFRPSPKPAVV